MSSLPTGLARIDEMRMVNICKSFPGVRANDQVNFDVRAGEIHALLGENGAGKSTLMRQLYGLYQPDSGEIMINGKPARFQSPNDAIAAGIGMIHQHFMLVETNVAGSPRPSALTANVRQSTRTHWASHASDKG